MSSQVCAGIQEFGPEDQDDMGIEVLGACREVAFALVIEDSADLLDVCLGHRGEVLRARAEQGGSIQPSWRGRMVDPDAASAP